MQPKIIKNDEGHRAALARLDELMESDPELGTPESDELELWAKLIEDYEAEHYSAPLPTPRDMIEFIMEQRGLARSDLVPYFGAKSAVSMFLSGRRDLTLKQMRALHSGLGVPAAVLLQGSGVHLPPESGLDFERFPIGEMIRRGWIRFEGKIQEAKSRSEELITPFLERAFGEQGLSIGFPRQNVRAGSEPDLYALLAWTAQSIIEAGSGGPTFSKENVDDEFVKHLFQQSVFPDGPLRARDLLRSVGIRFATVPHLTGTHLDGAAFLLDDGSPVLAMTLRHDRLDNFWFVLAHELGHIVLHLDRERPRIWDDLEVRSQERIEIEADTWAARALIPDEVWHRAGRITGKRRACQMIALELGISEAIPAGRFRHEAKNFRMLSQLVGNGAVRSLFFLDDDYSPGRN